MYNKGIIIAGLAVFIVLVTFPFWFNQGKAAPAPQRILAPEAKAAQACILSAELMRTEHMQMLNDWRNMVVRDGTRLYIGSNGKKFEMSLSNTCLECHSNKAEFCDRCHNYAAVTPYCWDCHIDNPKEIK
jgi:hypothetical protein